MKLDENFKKKLEELIIEFKISTKTRITINQIGENYVNMTFSGSVSPYYEMFAKLLEERFKIKVKMRGISKIHESYTLNYFFDDG